MELLIKNIMIVDGTGAPAYRGTVGVDQGKICLVVKDDEIDFNTDLEEISPEVQIIDGEGLHLAPGFIDPHSHGDGIYGTPHGQLCKTSQGITTEVCGQCGFSFYPVDPRTLGQLQQFLTLFTNEFSKDMEQWTDFSTYQKYVESLPLTCNTAILTGHGTLRVAVMGNENRKPTEEELERMKTMLKEAMEHGSMGLSTGLIYAPGSFSQLEEIVELAKVIAPYDGIYMTHLRNESYDVVNAVKEALEVGRRAGVRVQISHHKAYGIKNWGLSKETLRLISEAIASGQEVTLDQYPYEASMTHLNVLIPPQYFDGGVDCLLARLKDPDCREAMKAEMMDETAEFDNYYLNCGGWDGVFTSVLPETPQYSGMFISDIAKQLGKDPFDTYFDLVLENRGEGSGIYFSMGEEDLFRIIQDPNAMVGTDGLCKAMDEKGHPRAWGTFPHAICYFHKEKQLMSLEEIIRKMTSLPAQRLKLFTKGVIEEGKDADLVLFDYDKLQDRASYENSNQVTEGIEYVIVGGQIVYQDQKLTGVYPGKLILHGNGACKK